MAPASSLSGGTATSGSSSKVKRGPTCSRPRVRTGVTLLTATMRRDIFLVKAALKEDGEASTISVTRRICSPQRPPNARNGERRVLATHPSRSVPTSWNTTDRVKDCRLDHSAVLYRFIAREGGNAFGDLLAAQNEGILVIHLSDGCVSFETTILLGSSGGGDPWAPLDLLLTEVTIEKSHGVRAGPRPPPGTGYSAIVRSGRKGE